MAPADHENQLELFDVAAPPRRRPHREAMGHVAIHLRHDQLVLTGIAGLIGVAVVFACGVERGKQLVRFERTMLVRQQADRPPAPSQGETNSSPDGAKIPAASATTDEQPKAPQKPPASLKVKVPSKLASASEAMPGRGAGGSAVPSAAQAGGSRYAVQVVTFNRPQSAKQELERLRARGERAFLVMREGRTAVYVGPFPSKSNAREKLTTLKAHYQDCFVRTL